MSEYDDPKYPYAEIRPASAPIEGQFIMAWRTRRMKAPAFTTYATEHEARQALSRWLKQHPDTALMIRIPGRTVYA